MHSLQFLSALLSVAFAIPQGVNYAKVDAQLPDSTLHAPPTPTFVSFDPIAALESVKAMAYKGGFRKTKRDSIYLKEREDNSGCGTCQPQPTIQNYYGVKVATAADFLADTIISGLATKAILPTGYSQVYSNLAFASNGYIYMGYEILDKPNGYNPNACASRCNSLPGCSAFNIYFERDPVVDACSQTCQNPPAYANLKCAYWGNPLVAASARVEGQWRNKFHAVIAGSNAYVNSTVLLDTAYINAFLGEAAIEAPIDCKGTDTFMGYKLFDNVPFDVRLCAAACTAKTIYNRSQGSKRSCNFWNTYMLLKDGVAQGQFCAMYTTSWDTSFATNLGQHADGSQYTISSSYVGTNATFVPVCPSSPGFA